MCNEEFVIFAGRGLLPEILIVTPTDWEMIHHFAYAQLNLISNSYTYIRHQLLKKEGTS